jgi:hypothetical protein
MKTAEKQLVFNKDIGKIIPSPVPTSQQIATTIGDQRPIQQHLQELATTKGERITKEDLISQPETWTTKTSSLIKSNLPTMNIGV